MFDLVACQLNLMQKPQINSEIAQAMFELPPTQPTRGNPSFLPHPRPHPGPVWGTLTEPGSENGREINEDGENRTHQRNLNATEFIDEKNSARWKRKHRT